jgi:hypothetical protein
MLQKMGIDLVITLEMVEHVTSMHITWAILKFMVGMVKFYRFKWVYNIRQSFCQFGK